MNSLTIYLLVRNFSKKTQKSNNSFFAVFFLCNLYLENMTIILNGKKCYDKIKLQQNFYSGDEWTCKISVTFLEMFFSQTFIF